MPGPRHTLVCVCCCAVPPQDTELHRACPLLSSMDLRCVRCSSRPERLDGCLCLCVACAWLCGEWGDCCRGSCAWGDVAWLLVGSGLPVDGECRVGMESVLMRAVCCCMCACVCMSVGDCLSCVGRLLRGC